MHNAGGLILPPLEDSNAIQFCVMEVMRGILEQRLDRATANTLLYALQIAHSNLRGVTVGQTDNDNEEEDAGSLADLLLRKLDDATGNTDADPVAAEASAEPKA